MSQITGRWEIRAEIPQAARGISCAAVDQKIYCIGGMGKNNNVDIFSTNYIYDTVTDTWSTGRPLPNPIVGMGCVSQGRKIYCISGREHTDSLKTVYIYDVDEDLWSRGADCPIPQAVEGGCTVLNGKIYLIGGVSVVNGTATYLSTVQIYDPQTDSWESGAPLPEKIHTTQAVTFRNKIYVVGGHEVTNTFNNILYRYDPEQGVWDQEGELPDSLRDLRNHFCVVWNDLICCIGGVPSSPTFKAYDPETKSWQDGPDMLEGTHNNSCSVVDDNIYCIGGWSGGPSSLNQVFIPDVVTNPEEYQLRLFLEQGESQQLSGIMLPSGITVEDVDWSSEDTAIVQVDENGLVTGISVGKAVVTVTAKDGSWRDSILIQVLEAEVEPEYRLSILLQTGEICRLSASNDLYEVFLWTSDDTSVATVSDTGKVTAVAPGITIMTVMSKDGEFKDQVFVKVED